MTKRLWGHVPVGLVNVAFYIINPLWGLGFTIGFLAYEFIQEWRKVDHSHKDVIGWLWGMGAGMLISGFVQMLIALEVL